ncbi:PAS domain S-box protein [Aliagarivorans taiwanensis]|uniref:PAS domain S-box protein n=1 Tax=Aliagarivorans taiwanensis TaxID=561966 RepID=UPI0004163743|nr:PAS domain S-box protein [Aliagarivorans taiwanensis]
MAIAEVYTEDLHAYLAVVKDQTEHQQRKASERFLRHALEERELIYRTAFGQAAMGIARISLEGQFIEVNMKLCQLFGYPEKAFLRLNYADISLDKDNAAQQLWQRLKEGQIDNFSDDLEFVTRRGETFWANLAVSLVSTDTGEAKYFIAIFEDITSRKASEQKLQDSKQQIDELLRGMQVASDAGGICNWSLDLVTGEVKWDEGSFALFGYSPDETASYELWKRAVHPDDMSNAEQSLSMAIQDGSDYHAEYRAYCQSTGELRWVKSAGSVVTNEDNQAVVIHGINLDITEEREIQAKLAQESQAAQQANKAKSQFLATMSHEIRTPMNGIIGMVDLLKDTSLSDDQTRMVQTVKDSSYALLDIINDILDFSKIESGQMELEILNISILSTVEKMIDTVWINANRKSVRLCVLARTEIPDELQLDPVRVRQVLLNLVGNAIKFTSGEQQHDRVSIILAYDKVRGMLNMQIEDTGIGMNQAQIGSLFKPFTQADSSTTRQYGGTGLGLSITKSFVDLMGGSVSVSSEAGKGSCFAVEIPSTPASEFVDVFSKYDVSHFSIVLLVKDPLHSRVCRDLAERLGPREILDDLPEDSLENLNQVVVITDNDDDNISMFGWRMLLLNEDPLSEHGSVTPTYYVVGAHPLKPSDLMFGVAVLCGLDSAELHALSNVIDLDHIPALADREQAERQGRVILCAEDQPTNRLVLSKQLDKLGYCYDMAEDGLEALELWTRHQHRVVLTDCHMPKMDGFELTKAIRQIEKPQNRPTIIAITANALTGESENCRNAGMDDYLSKPVDLKALQKCLSNHFKDLRESLEPAPIVEEPDGITVEGIDNEHLYRVLGCDDEELAKSVLAMFWTSLESDQQRLNEAVGSADFNSIRSIAHGAKGATASSGALELSELFKQIEHQYQDIDTVNKILVDIDLLANKIGDSLRQSHIV